MEMYIIDRYTSDILCCEVTKLTKGSFGEVYLAFMADQSGAGVVDFQENLKVHSELSARV